MSSDVLGEGATCRFIVPMKPLGFAKMRLRNDLPPSVCDALALFMLRAALRAAAPDRGVTGSGISCVVVGGDEFVRRIAEEAGAGWSPERGEGLNGALRAAMQDAYAEGVDAAAYLPGDLPLIRSEDVVRIARAGWELGRPVGVPAEGDGGTNALLIPAGAAMTPDLGENSYARHCEAARRAGATLRTMRLPRVMVDVDTYDDVSRLMRVWPGFGALLAEWEGWILGGMSGASPEGEFPGDVLSYSYG